MIRSLTLATLAVLLATSPAAACYSWRCNESKPTSGRAPTALEATRKHEPSASKPSRSYITNPSRQILGDVYDPGAGRRLQIRDKHRRIIGYIERDGTITNPSRQPIGTLDRALEGHYPR